MPKRVSDTGNSWLQRVEKFFHPIAAGAGTFSLSLLIIHILRPDTWSDLPLIALAAALGLSAAGILGLRDGHRTPLPRWPVPKPPGRSESASGRGEDHYSLAARATNDGYWDWDLKTGRIHYSTRWKSMLGFHEAEIDCDPDAWLGRVHPEDTALLRSILQDHLSGRVPHFEAEYRILHKDGHYRWMLSRGLAARDDGGVAVRMAGAQTDITQRKQSEERLIFRAFHDELTGLANRTLLTERLRDALERLRAGENNPFAVLFLDLDRFKNINDSLGHLVGDELLKSVANRLRSETQSEQMVARLGGDEFAILLENVKSPIDALRVSNTIRKKFRGAFKLDGREIFITPSIGVAWGRKTYEKPEDLLRDADIAMYQAKKQGRNCCEVFAKKMHSRAVDLLQLENDLHRAIQNDELLMHYQPIVCLKTNEVIGLEALIRWDHPEQGLLFPKDFLGVAEESGLIVPLSWWALEEAARKTKAWVEEFGFEGAFSVSVNLAGRQVLQLDLVQKVTEILAQQKLDAKFIHLEITEGVLMQHADSSVGRLAELQKRGLQLHLDDFGTGYSSLSYLDRFPFDALKIDRSFISKLDAKGENWKIVRAMVDLAHNLGMQVIVEGLETLQQIELMKTLRCEFGQGYYFSPPVDQQAVEAMLQEKARLNASQANYWRQAKTG